MKSFERAEQSILEWMGLEGDLKGMGRRFFRRMRGKVGIGFIRTGLCMRTKDVPGHPFR